MIIWYQGDSYAKATFFYFCIYHLFQSTEGPKGWKRSIKMTLKEFNSNSHINNENKKDQAEILLQPASKNFPLMNVKGGIKLPSTNPFYYTLYDPHDYRMTPEEAAEYDNFLF